MRRRRIPKRNEYGGKCFCWSDASEARLMQLIEGGATGLRAALILNREFRQRVKLTDDAVFGKVYRLRHHAHAKREGRT